MEKEIEASMSFWNQAYKGLKAQKADIKDSLPPVEMKGIFNEYVQKGHRSLDFGCGEGRFLFMLENRSEIDEAVGIEKGNFIVKYVSDMIKLNGAKKIQIKDGGLKALEEYPDGYFDTASAFNVLDVVTLEQAGVILSSLKRVIKPKGFLLIKINPDFSPELLCQMGFTCFKDNLYAKNGVMRARIQKEEEWENELERGFKLVKKTLVPWRTPKYFDRLFLLEKE